ncbi:MULTISPECIES: GntR family transcriptional regulator [unclassified Brevundimonas]|uniref:GntR family transcriptional regulator n=1 Tax=unclassified Brevundimonas TaxID=2622653 RepID=UPI001304FB1D|nr:MULTISPECIES: GntR family transcriptional regulator [unclassified Brevundimonas]
MRDPYHQALAALSEFAGEGRFGSGMPLVITRLAEELRLSPTPVREALARLAGEGIIEHWPGRGYFALSLGATDIAELYDYHQRLVLWAIDLPIVATIERPDMGEASPGGRLEQVFARVTARSGNRVLNRAYRLAAARLRPIRLVEAVAAPLAPEVADRLEGLLEDNCILEFKAAAVRYHEGRIRLAGSIAGAMRRSEQSID